jgi:GTPase SAR1 family protein
MGKFIQLVIGPAGVGKSMFIREYIKHFLKKYILDALI